MIHHFIAAFLKRSLGPSPPVDITIDLPRSATVTNFLCVRLLRTPLEYMINRSPLSPESTLSVIAHGITPKEVFDLLHSIRTSYIQNEALSASVWIEQCSLKDQSTYLIPVEGGQAISAWQQVWDVSHSLV